MEKFTYLATANYKGKQMIESKIDKEKQYFSRKPFFLKNRKKYCCYFFSLCMLCAWICPNIYKHACAWPHGLWCWSFHSTLFCALYYPIAEIILLPIFIDKGTCIIKLFFPAHDVRMLSVVQRGAKCCLQHSSLIFLISWCILSVCMNNCKCICVTNVVLIIAKVCISVQLWASLVSTCLQIWCLHHIFHN